MGAFGGWLHGWKAEGAGKLRFAPGAVFDLEAPSSLSRRERHVIAAATGGIEGVPASVFSDGKETYWKLSVGKDELGVDTLYLHWECGMTITVW